MAKKKTKEKVNKYFKLFKWILLIPVIAFLLSVYFLNSIKIENSTKKVTTPQPQASQSTQQLPSSSHVPESIKTPSSQTPKTHQSSTGIPILTYHYIANNPNPKDTTRDALEVTPDTFEEQMQYLASNGFNPISLDTLYGIFNKQINSPPKPVVLTFDDGYIDFYTNAFPILRRFGFHAVAFIPTGLIGQSYYMSWDQIKEIQSSGLVSFQAHSVTHQSLTALAEAGKINDLNYQIKESKRVLEEKLGIGVNSFAYPYGLGGFNPTVVQAIRAAGFVGALGTWYEKAQGISMNMPRIKVSGFWSLKEFASRL